MPGSERNGDSSRETNRPPQLLGPNHNIGRSLLAFERPQSPSTSKTSLSATSSPISSRPTSPHSPRRTSISSSIPTSRVSTPGTPTPLQSQLLLPPLDKPPSPLIICFHGSGDSCRRSWRPLAKELAKEYRVLLYERSPLGDPTSETSELLAYLAKEGLVGPYVLVAHSHGGAFARCFLHENRKEVAGMVMVETGQEATWDAKLQEKQEDNHVLDESPLVVIKGKSLRRKWKDLEKDEKSMKERHEKGERVSESEKARLMMMKNEMTKWEKEDERLKRKQLKMSKKNKFIDLPDVGHQVIRDKPETVLEAVNWVMANMPDRGRPSTRDGEEKSRTSSMPWLRKMSLALTGKDDKRSISQ